jgi:hypothetical protein
MAMIHRRWTEEETAVLRALAGNRPPEDIAEAIGRTRAAVMIRAHEMHLSLRRLDPDGVERNWATPFPTVSGGLSAKGRRVPPKEPPHSSSR